MVVTAEAINLSDLNHDVLQRPAADSQLEHSPADLDAGTGLCVGPHSPQAQVLLLA